MSILDDYTPGDDYFDVAQGLYWYAVHYYNGMMDPLYELQCSLGYKPALSESGPEGNETAQDIYSALEAGELDVQDAKAFVEAGLRD